MELESDSKIFFRLFLKISENILKIRRNNGFVRKGWVMSGLKNYYWRNRKTGKLGKTTIKMNRFYCILLLISSFKGVKCLFIIAHTIDESTAS